MDPHIVQNFRYKLQKRIRRLNSVEYRMFAPTLRQFWLFFDNHPVYPGIIASLLSNFPNLDEIVEMIFSRQGFIGDSEEEAAAIGYAVLRRYSSEDNKVDIFDLARPYGPTSKDYIALETFRSVFLEPFYEYVDENLDDQQAMLSLLFRYKQRCEWFRRDHLWKVIQQDSRKAEKLLALDLYEYIFDQGINFTIEPSSITGAIDLIAAQGSDDPLLADTKIFDADGRSKAYIRKAFNQIYTYTQQYNEPVGYIVIYKTTDTDLRFSLKAPSKNIPMVMYNHKTIFLLTIDIYPHSKPVSQRHPLKAIEITEEEFVQTIVDTYEEAA